MSYRAQRREFLFFEFLRFVNKDRNSDAVLLRRVRKIVNELLQVGVEDSGVCAAAGYRR
ncbi:hypothetical protein [Humibacter ginsengiterrae]